MRALDLVVTFAKRNVLFEVFCAFSGVVPATKIGAWLADDGILRPIDLAMRNRGVEYRC